jgi:hypothetical protein
MPAFPDSHTYNDAQGQIVTTAVLVPILSSIVSGGVEVTGRKGDSHVDEVGMTERPSFYPVSRCEALQDVRIVVDSGVSHAKRFEDILLEEGSVWLTGGLFSTTMPSRMYPEFNCGIAPSSGIRRL